MSKKTITLTLTDADRVSIMNALHDASLGADGFYHLKIEADQEETVETDGDPASDETTHVE